METLLHDIRYASRQFQRARGFFVTAVATLALGIGINTALFSFISAFLGPMPGVRESDDLVWVSAVDVRSQRPERISRADFESYRDRTGAFAEAALILDQSFAIAGEGEPEQVKGQAVSGNYFALLRTPFALGRGFTTEEEATFQSVVVISHSLWQRRFQGDPGIIGRILFVNRRPHTVVGVASEGFIGADRDTLRALWVPASSLTDLFPAWTTLRDRDLMVYRVIARLRPGVGVAQGDAEVAGIASSLATSSPATHEHLSARTYPASSGMPANGVGQVLPVVGIALMVTGLILLIACANVSNLLLARGVERRSEIGLRLAIGACRGRLVRQLLTESLLLAAIASAFGLLFALWTLDVVKSFVPLLPIVPSIDGWVLAFALAAAGAVAIVTGLAPALISTHASYASTLKTAARGAGIHRSRLQSGFVICQIALSLVLLVMAGLFLRSLEKASRIDVGFDASRRVLAATFDLGMQQPDEARARAFLDAVIERASALPGVTDVSLTTALPMAEWMRANIEVLSGDPAASRELTPTQFIVRPAFFRTIGLRLVRGRDFDARDITGAPAVAIVNEALARAAWPGRDPIGQLIRIEGRESSVFIVGLAQNSVVTGIEASEVPALYLPHLQSPASATLTLLVRASRDAGQLAPALRQQIASVDSQLPVSRLQTLDRFRDDAVAGRRAGASLLALFGGLGLALAAVGVAGAMALTVGQRTREIGVRLALGAAPKQVVRHFVWRGMRLTALGIGIGMSAALAASRAVESMLFGITASDAIAYIGVAAAFAAVAVLACWLPARRAARVDPLTALAGE